MKTQKSGKNLVVILPQKFSLSQTLDCGQSFRWRRGENENFYSGVVGNKHLVVSQPDETTIVFHDTTLEDFEKFWRAYFDLERDYDGIKQILSRDDTLAKAIDFCGGIRVLNQPKWETLCSYIVSQNNNIPRIKSIIEKLCENFGRQAAGSERRSFPTANELAQASTADFEKLGLGYRAPYIAGAAQAVAEGALCLDTIATLPIDEARKELRKLLGVGPKVAECALLYGFGKSEAFPIDTWIKGVMARFYPDGLPDFVKPHAGIAQIFLFHYVRNLPK